MFNDFDGSEYWLTFRHKVTRAEPKDVQFIGLRITDNQVNHDFVMPAFPQPLSFLPLGSLYRCGRVLFSVALYQDGVDIALFSKLEDNITWMDDKDEWSWGFRKKTN